MQTSALPLATARPLKLRRKSRRSNSSAGLMTRATAFDEAGTCSHAVLADRETWFIIHLLSAFASPLRRTIFALAGESEDWSGKQDSNRDFDLGKVALCH